MESKVVTVLYFAAASTATGLTSEKISIPDDGLKLSDLTEVLNQHHEGKGLKGIIETSQWSVDLEMVEDPDRVLLRGGEEVGIICPVSGG
ncbi:hypothetical protein D9613_007759 [Agrocybe pediades]|uniref:MOCS2A n=1 Tax=Agrocybe pediades TaxID=84607 RepID=A0A8H4QNQ3_9AGAR|nr:hypothetical protein D9613_007759 [Agrocybe pediades]KAF9565225.1 hypothetical protein CPC08DRAFT_704760 [Agrocybe pediades]